MANWRAGTNLVTILKTLTMSRIAGLTNRPIIRLSGEDDAGGDVDSGEVVIETELYKPEKMTNLWRHERYVLTGSYWFGEGISETIFKEVLEELDLTLQVANQLTNTRLYEYEMEYNWDTNMSVQVANLIFVLTKEFVSVTA